MDIKAIDKKGLIRESYRIEGITEGECRSILLDWALSMPLDADTSPAISALLDYHGADVPDHPMTAVLKQGLQKPNVTGKRRGGRAARVGTYS